MQPAEVRIELLKLLVPSASKVGITEPERIIDSCRKLESYVLESAPNGEEQPDSPTRGTLRLPRKGKQNEATPAFLTPPTGGQVDSSPR